MSQVTVVVGAGELGEGIGAGDNRLDRQRGAAGGEAVVRYGDGALPANGARGYRLAVIGVGVEVAQEARGLEAFQVTGDVSLPVVPANHAVGHHVEACGNLLFAMTSRVTSSSTLGEVLGGAFSSVGAGYRPAEPLSFGPFCVIFG